METTYGIHYNKMQKTNKPHESSVWIQMGGLQESPLSNIQSPHTTHTRLRRHRLFNSKQISTKKTRNYPIRGTKTCMWSSQRYSHYISLQNECGGMPVHFRRLQNSLKIGTKIISTKNHPTMEAMTDHWSKVHFGN